MNLRDFTNWALQESSVANPEPNYKYKGECVSLIQQYLYKILNIPFKARGNAKDWANNADVLTHFNKLDSKDMIKPGDILVYGEDYGQGYGHMGYINYDGKYVDQNGIKKYMVGIKNEPFKGYICILRSKENIDLGLEYTKGNYITNYVMKVRDGIWGNVKSKSELTDDGKKNSLDNGNYKKGTVFTALDVITGTDGSVWARTPSGFVCIKDNNMIYCNKV